MAFAALAPSVLMRQLAMLTPEERRALGLSRPATDEEIAQWEASQRQGAPVDFGGPVFPNPGNVRVSEDTESGEEPTRLMPGVKFDRSNPERSQILPGMMTTVGTKPSAVEGFDPSAEYEVETDQSAPAFNPDEEFEVEKQAETKQGGEIKLDTSQPLGMPAGIPGVTLPLYADATMQGIQRLGQSAREFGKGLWSMFEPPKDTAEKSIAALGPPAVPLYRMLRGLGHTAADATQALEAIRDINASPDPAGTYAMMAQGMASDGAVQALAALAGEGMVRGVPVSKTAQGVQKAMRSTPVREATKAAAKEIPKAALRRIPYVGKVGMDVARAYRRAKSAAAKAEPVPAEVPETITEPTPAEVLSKPRSTAELRKVLDEPLEKSLKESVGLKPVQPGQPIYKRPAEAIPKAAVAQEAPSLPEGFNPIESRALKGYKYDPAKRELEYITKEGQHYVRGDVAPEAFAQFEAKGAESWGRAWHELRNNPQGGVGVAKIVGGKRIAVRPAILETPEGKVIPKAKAGMVEQEGELLGQLKKSVESVKSAKVGLITSAEPAELMKRWGVDQESLIAGREQTRGMSPAEVETQIQKLTEAYKKGKPIEPIMETRDAANNLLDVDGRMRVIAAQRAGIKRIPVIVRRMTKAQ